MKRKLLIILITITVLLSFNATFASEHGNETLTLHKSALELSVEETPEIILGENDVGTFKDLKSEIDSAPVGGEIKLNKSYEYTPATDTGSVGIYTSIPISKTIIIDGQGHTLDGKNSKTIFSISSKSDIVLKNIIFKNGYASGNGGSITGGGAHNLKIINCTFINSVAPTHGGAVFLSQSNNVVFDSCDFINNAANETYSTRGGAIYWIYGEGGTLTNCNFIKNKAHYGGAVYIEYANGIHQSNNRYENNSATNFGGDIFCDDKCADLHDCNFTNSHADNYGGSIYCKCSNAVIYNLKFLNTSAAYGGAIYFTNGKNMTVKKSAFRDYKASSYGGAIYVSSPESTVLDCDFDNGQAAIAGAVYIQGAGVSIIDSRFKNNNATGGNGGTVNIYGDNAVINKSEFDGSISSSNGGIIYISGKNTQISDSQFKSGLAKNGGAVYLSGDNGVLDNNHFTDNLATTNGGAIFTESKDASIDNGYFIGNNATYGSAIFSQVNTWAKKDIITNINNARFIYNQAHSTSITVENVLGKKFKATFRANDNILNAIWHNGDVSCIFMDGVNPQNGVENSNNGELVYKDTREFNQIIIVEEFDDSGNLLKTEKLTTGLYGEVYYTATKGTTLRFSHPEDVFYKGVSGEADVPSFEISKITLNPKVFEDYDVSFVITVHNNGKIPLTNIVVSEDDFAGLIYKDYVKSGMWKYSSVDGVHTWSLNAKLLPDEYAILEVRFTAPDTGIFNNTASVICDEGISESANCSVEVIPDTFEAVKLSLMPVTKVGEQTIFEIVVHNTGDLDIHNVFVIEDSFEGLIFDHTIRDNLWNYSVVNGKHTWILKDSLAGHEYAGIFVVFNTTTIGNFTNYAIVGHEGQNKTVNATVWVNETVHDPDLIRPSLNISIETIHPLISLGNQTVFEIIVHNTGNIPLTGVTVEEYLYDYLIFHDFIIENDLWDYTPKNIPQATRVELLGAPVVNDHTWTMNTPLFVNEYLGFFVIFNSTKTGEFSNTVLGSSLQTPDKKPATDIVRVVHPEYVIEKIALVEGEVNVGDEVRFEIIVHNTGEIDVTDIEIQENPDSGLQYVTYEVEEGQWNKTGSVWKLNSDIVSDGYAAFIVVYKVTKSGNLTNTITSGDKTAKAVVTVNKTNETTPENNTVPDNNNTSPADNDDDNQQENTDPVDEDEGTDVPSDSDSGSPSGKTLKVNDKYATGNPILALLVVLISVVLIRRRE